MSQFKTVWVIRTYIVKGRDSKVLHKVYAFASTVRVRSVAYAIGSRKPAFVAQGHHVFAVKTLDVSTDFRCPVVNNAGVAAITSRLICQFPGEDGRATFVSIHEKLDVVPVNFLTLLVGVPRCRIASEGIVVACNSSEIRPSRRLRQTELRPWCIAVRVYLPIVHEGQD